MVIIVSFTLLVYDTATLDESMFLFVFSIASSHNHSVNHYIICKTLPMDYGVIIVVL